MEIDKNYLIDKFNATSSDDGNGNIESYESWLERQLISKIKELKQCQCVKSKPNYPEMVWCNNCNKEIKKQ